MSKKWERIKEIFHILDVWQILDFFLFPFIWMMSLLAKPFLKKDLWIVSENPNEACDNGYAFFQYLRKEKKEINAYYVIRKNSRDFEKVSKLGNVIIHRSFKHWIYYLNASKLIVTQKYANPSPALFYLLHVKGILKTPRIYLKHGIIKDDCKMHYYSRTRFRLMICGAKREYEYIKKKYGYPSQNVVYTGLARFDHLKKKTSKKKLILITPTWRKWIHSQKEFDIFMKQYEFLNDSGFLSLLEKQNTEVYMVLHKNMKKFEIPKSSCKIRHNEEVDIQELICRADLLITDYSSIFMDVAYLKTPMIYYQVDEEMYRKNQLQEGYFSYEKDGFGKVVREDYSLVNEIKKYMETDFKAESVYKKRMEQFFERRDQKNCERIFEEIEKI